MRKQNSERFPIISRLQDYIKGDKFIYTHEVREILRTIQNWWWLILCPTWTLDKDVNKDNPIFLPQIFKIARHVDCILTGRIVLEEEITQYVEYWRWNIYIERVNEWLDNLNERLVALFQ